MQSIKYQIMTEVNYGTNGSPDVRQIFTSASVPYSEKNLEFAKAEAYNGEVSIEDDGQPEPEPVPTLDDRVSSLETTKADQTDVDELNEALDMILTGYAGEEATDAEGTAG